MHAERGLALGAAGANLRGMIGWQHAFGDTAPESTHAFSAGDAFTIAGVPVARNSAVLEAGLDLSLSAAARLGPAYQGKLAGGAASHGVRANLAVRF